MFLLVVKSDYLLAYFILFYIISLQSETTLIQLVLQGQHEWGCIYTITVKIIC